MWVCTYMKIYVHGCVIYFPAIYFYVRVSVFINLYEHGCVFKFLHFKFLYVWVCSYIFNIYMNMGGVHFNSCTFTFLAFLRIKDDFCFDSCILSCFLYFYAFRIDFMHFYTFHKISQKYEVHSVHLESSKISSCSWRSSSCS